MEKTSEEYEHILPKVLDISQFRVFFIFLKLGFTPCKAEKSLQGMEVTRKEA